MKKRRAAAFFALCVISMTFAMTVQNLLSIIIGRFLAKRPNVFSPPYQWTSFDCDVSYVTVLVGTAVVAALVVHGKSKP